MMRARDFATRKHSALGRPVDLHLVYNVERKIYQEGHGLRLLRKICKSAIAWAHGFR